MQTEQLIRHILQAVSAISLKGDVFTDLKNFSVFLFTFFKNLRTKIRFMIIYHCVHYIPILSF